MKRLAVLTAAILMVALATVPSTTATAGEGQRLTKRQALRQMAGAAGARAGSMTAPGAAPAFGDFDDNGRQDLAVGIPSEVTNATYGEGAVQIFYGTASGVTPGNVLLTEALVTGADGIEGGESFGSALAAGDFNGDGISDLAVGMPGESTGPNFSNGAVAVFMGTPLGLTAASPTQFITENDVSFDGPQNGDGFGSALAAGKFDTGPTFDLAIGIPGETVCDFCSSPIYGAGAVVTVHGGPSGLDLATGMGFAQSSSLVNGTSEEYDGWGLILVSANFGRSAQWDLAIGSTEDVAEEEDAGAVSVLYGTKMSHPALGNINGIYPINDQIWTQNTDGVKDVAEDLDLFGALGLAAGNVGGSSHADLIVGAPAEGGQGGDLHGMVHVLFGSNSGVTSKGNKTFTQNTSGVPDKNEFFDLFGYRVAAGDVNGDGRADLIASGPGETFGTGATARALAGAVWVLRSTSTGPTGTGAKSFSQNTTGIPDTAETSDVFGISLASANYGRSSHWDIAIGVRGETINDSAADPLSSVGVVHLLFGSATGTTTTGDQFLWQGMPGSPDPAEDFDNFGTSLN